MAEAVQRRWELAHRPAGAEQATFVQLDALTGWDAVERLRVELADGDRVLLVRRID